MKIQHIIKTGLGWASVYGIDSNGKTIKTEVCNPDALNALETKNPYYNKKQASYYFLDKLKEAAEQRCIRSVNNHLYLSSEGIDDRIECLKRQLEVLVRAGNHDASEMIAREIKKLNDKKQ